MARNVSLRLNDVVIIIRSDATILVGTARETVILEFLIPLAVPPAASQFDVGS